MNRRTPITASKKRIKKNIIRIIASILVMAISLAFAFPFIYMILMSFMPTSTAIFAYPPQIDVKTFRPQNYIDAFEYIEMFKLFGNTMILVVASMVIGITCSVLVAYGFARFNGKGKNVWFVILLSTMMIPWVVTMIPAYVEFEFLGWIGTRLPLIIPWIGGSAFNIFMLRQFIMMIPKELDEAAIMDGASRFTILTKVILPELKPVLGTLMIFSFINAWSDYVGPSIYLQDSELYTLSLGMQLFFSATGATNWAYVMAASVMFATPMVLVLLLFQKSFVRGIATSGIK